MPLTKEQENKLVELLAGKRISKEDIQIIKGVFENREHLFLVVRNAILGFELTQEEKDLLGSCQNPEVAKVLRKIFFPELQKDVPIGQNYNLWKTRDIDQARPEDFEFIKQKKKVFFELILNGLKRVAGEDVKNDLEITEENTLAEVQAKMSFVDWVEDQFKQTLIPVAFASEMSTEELAKRLGLKSNK